MDATTPVLLAAVAFVGTHLLMSHPLRRPLVQALGEPAFAGLYSAVALATLVWLVFAYYTAPATAPLWAVGNVLWAVVTILMLLASVLLMGSIAGNPALPSPGAARRVPLQARGVFAVTRHPMMWAVALWGVCHIAVYPVGKNIVVAASMIVLALVGAASQDRKKQRLQPKSWPGWEQRTSYWPFAAVLSGRARLGGLGMHALGGGLVVWLAATWAHIPLGGWAAGIWRWIL